MIEQAINFIASIFDIPKGVGLEVKGYAILMGALFLLVTLAEVLTAFYGRTKGKKKVEKDVLHQATGERFAH